MADTVYVSITGLRLKRPWHIFAFTWHATKSFRQVQQAKGLISADAKTIAGVRHTRTVWKSRADMLAFLHAGAHRHAIRAFPSIAHGKTFGFETNDIPDWNEVHRLWQERGKTYEVKQSTDAARVMPVACSGHSTSSNSSSKVL